MKTIIIFEDGQEIRRVENVDDFVIGAFTDNRTKQFIRFEGDEKEISEITLKIGDRVIEKIIKPTMEKELKSSAIDNLIYALMYL